MDEIRLIIKALENAPPEKLTPRESTEAAELAARLHWRAVKLWGGEYSRDSAAERPVSEIAADIARMVHARK